MYTIMSTLLFLLTFSVISLKIYTKTLDPVWIAVHFQCKWLKSTKSAIFKIYTLNYGRYASIGQTLV